jgi:hypothetical protein
MGKKGWESRGKGEGKGCGESVFRLAPGLPASKLAGTRASTSDARTDQPRKLLHLEKRSHRQEVLSMCMEVLPSSRRSRRATLAAPRRWKSQRQELASIVGPPRRDNCADCAEYELPETRMRPKTMNGRVGRLLLTLVTQRRITERRQNWSAYTVDEFMHSGKCYENACSEF